MPSTPNVPWIDDSVESDLLHAARQGDAAAFRKLVDAHRRQHYALCFAMSGRTDDAAQLMLESARLAWRGLKMLPSGRPFFPYLARIVRNLVIVHRRRNAGVPHELPIHRPSGIPWGSTGTGAPDPGLAAEEQRLLLAYRDFALDPQILLALKVALGLGYPEIGAMLELPPGSVMHRLQALRTQLEGPAPATEEAA